MGQTEREDSTQLDPEPVAPVGLPDFLRFHRTTSRLATAAAGDQAGTRLKLAPLLPNCQQSDRKTRSNKDEYAKYYQKRKQYGHAAAVLNGFIVAMNASANPK
jgi:hypothetical protein